MVNGLLPITAGGMTLYGEDLAHISKTKLRELRRGVSPWSFRTSPSAAPDGEENAAPCLEIQE